MQLSRSTKVQSSQKVFQGPFGTGVLRYFAVMNGAHWNWWGQVGRSTVVGARANDRQFQLILGLSPSSSLLRSTKGTLRLSRRKSTDSSTLCNRPTEDRLAQWISLPLVIWHSGLNGATKALLWNGKLFHLFQNMAIPLHLGVLLIGLRAFALKSWW